MAELSSPRADNPSILLELPASATHAAICIRRAGDNNMLVEFGAPVLDLVLLGLGRSRFAPALPAPLLASADTLARHAGRVVEGAFPGRALVSDGVAAR